MPDIVVAGAAGRMGSRLVACLHDTPDVRLVAALEAPGHGALWRDAGEPARAGRLGGAVGGAAAAAPWGGARARARGGGVGAPPSAAPPPRRSRASACSSSSPCPRRASSTC